MNGEPRNWCSACQADHTRYDNGKWGEATTCPNAPAWKPLTQAEYDAALVGHDSDGNYPLIERGADELFLEGENGLVTLKVFSGLEGGSIELSVAECRKLAAALVRLADIWCVS